jgi:hypothetical protein
MGQFDVRRDSQLLPGTAQQAGGGVVERSETTKGRCERRDAFVRPIRPFNLSASSDPSDLEAAP